jgi:trehalose 6-phosphate phosphatase
MSANAIDSAVAAAVAVLRKRPSALISDIDGTLSPIVATPEQAVVLPECRSALKTLTDRLDLVAVISGRTVAEARRMVGLNDLLYIGNHGLERWDRADGYRNEAAAFQDDMRLLRGWLEEALAVLPDVRIEDKGAVLSLHYRGAAQPEAARRKVLEVLGRLLSPGRFIVAEGKMVIEVRPPLNLDKGTIVERLVEERDLHGVVFLGDDLTDVDGMRALKRLRTEDLASLAIGVAGEEAPPGLVDESDILLPDPQAVATFLARLAALPPSTPRS